MKVVIEGTDGIDRQRIKILEDFFNKVTVCEPAALTKAENYRRFLQRQIDQSGVMVIGPLYRAMVYSANNYFSKHGGYHFVDCAKKEPGGLIICNGMEENRVLCFHNAEDVVSFRNVLVNSTEDGNLRPILQNYWTNDKEGSEWRGGFYSAIQYI